jgi:RNA polymerase II subunit A-like phosphatase
VNQLKEDAFSGEYIHQPALSHHHNIYLIGIESSRFEKFVICSFINSNVAHDICCVLTHYMSATGKGKKVSVKTKRIRCATQAVSIFFLLYLYKRVTTFFTMSQNGDHGSYGNNDIKKIKFDLNKSIQVGKIRVRIDTRLTKNDIIFTMIDMYGRRESFLSPISGTVTKLCIHELDILSYGSIILQYEECRHESTFYNLCVACGIDVNQLNNTLPASNYVRAAISMEPSFPAIKISLEEASKYSNEERNHLLRKRKLHLLVDLDQTLVHTTNANNYYPSSPDVASFQLNIPLSQTLYTKLRPGVKEFLANLESFYQFHVVTFGDRLYANSIVKLIDPNRTFFAHRILSRDECVSLTDKSANLSNLFPCGDSLVCIIDDREDVWNYAPNLVQVKPYTWFKDVGDINDPYLPSLIETKHEKTQPGENRKTYSENDELSIDLEKSLHLQASAVEDTDTYLRELEVILKRIHTVFYKAYDQWVEDKQGTMPDLKQIMPNVRQQVLNSVSICFSHMMPQDYPLEKYCGTIIAKAMGAKVTHDLEFDSKGVIQTTHVVAGKQTFKVYQARQNNIKVVTPEWLVDCYEQWEKKPEENYMLTADYKVRKCRLFTETTPRVSKRRHCDTQQVPIAEKSFSNQQENLTNYIDERFGIEKNLNNLHIEDDDDSSEIRPQRSKRQCTVSLSTTVDQRTYDYDDHDDEDLSIGDKLHNLILGNKDGHNSSDEENLGDDDTPLGWKNILSDVVVSEDE